MAQVSVNMINKNMLYNSNVSIESEMPLINQLCHENYNFERQREFQFSEKKGRMIKILPPMEAQMPQILERQRSFRVDE